MIDIGESASKQPLENSVNLFLGRYPTALVDIGLVDQLEGTGDTLEHVEHFPHVTLSQLHQCLFAVLGGRHTLLLDHIVQSIHYLARLQRCKSKLGTARLDGRNDLVQVVADETKAHIFRILLNNCNNVSLNFN